MAQQLILINGIPGAGKTTLSKQLGKHLNIPVLSKDTLMDAFADATAATVQDSQLGALASETMWQLAGLISGSVVVESFWLKRRDLEYARAGLEKAGDPDFVEIWCEVPSTLAWSRFLVRKQHAIHPAGETARARWDEWVKNPEPLAIGPVITVETDVPVDIEELIQQISTHLGDDNALGMTLPR
jgi:predicted kinase